VSSASGPPAVLGIDHVQITVPRGREDAARWFYCDVLAMREVPKPQSLAARGGFWVAPGDGPLVHVGVEDGVNRAATKAHVAYAVRNLRGWKQRLEQHGIRPLESVAIPGFDRFEFRDPFDNRVEMIEPVAEAPGASASAPAGAVRKGFPVR